LSTERNETSKSEPSTKKIEQILLKSHRFLGNFLTMPKTRCAGPTMSVINRERNGDHMKKQRGGTHQPTGNDWRGGLSERAFLVSQGEARPRRSPRRSMHRTQARDGATGNSAAATTKKYSALLTIGDNRPRQR
jgi:hypothetical protein